jgi:hypothetical protein
VLPGRDADHSPPSSAEVVNEQELYLLSPQAPPWRVAGLLCLPCRVPTQDGGYVQTGHYTGPRTTSTYSVVFSLYPV